nr:MAG TPA: hypothetical protein [Caudoviricetes sp.]
MAYGSYIGEVVAPIMIILGIFSRIEAARYRHESNDNMRPPQTWKFT